VDVFQRLAENRRRVEERIAAACGRSGRRQKEVRVIAVTKYVSLQMTEWVLDSGLEHIGENRWQDARAKWEKLGHRGMWHFIGHLQTNKVKDVVGKFAYIHSLDRLSLAQEIEKKAAALELTARCLIQVNVSGEQSKHGLPPDELFSFADKLREFPHIRIEGLMTMAPLDAGPEQTRPVFRGLRELRDTLNGKQIFPYEVKELSMGMSGDFEIAVEEGATWIRLGSILVGREG